MQHLNEEQFVEHYYHDDAAPSAVEEHLRACAECRAQYDTLRRVLTLVTEAPVPERDEEYGERVWKTLRWKLERRARRRTWAQVLATAATIALAFFAGQLWQGRNAAVAPSVNTASVKVTPTAGDHGDRVLLFVVSDHLDSSERVLLQVANADPRKSLELGGGQQERTAELVTSNRLYRQTATQRGDERIAAILSDLEPVLVELSNAGQTLSSDELSELQKRIESKGLLFKVRVIGAQVGGADEKPVPQNTDNLL